MRRTRRAAAVSTTLLMAAASAALLIRASSAQQTQGGQSTPAADPLPRKAQMGAAFAPDPAGGLRTQMVGPDTPAARAGLRPGDVLVSVDGAKTTTLPAFLGTLARRKPGDALTVQLRRGSETLTETVTLAERPREASPGFDVVYDSVVSGDARLRTLVTRPHVAGKRPVVFLIQGLGCFSVDNPPPGDAYRTILHELTRRGYVTLRVDKPGTGDSEGGPCRDNDFRTVLDGYRQALASLKKYDFVDTNNVFIFGHSMGGIMGPVLAGEMPVKGLVVYGTTSKTWFEYVLENSRRQREMAADADPAALDTAQRREAAFHHYLFAEKQTPEQIVKTRPELQAVAAENVQDGKYMAGGRHFSFFQQLSDVDPSALWTRVGDAHVLALWGQSDFVSSGEDHARIARLVNAARPGHGTYRPLAGIDHFLNQAASPEASLKQAQTPPGQPPAPFHPLITETLRAWLDEKSGKPRS